MAQSKSSIHGSSSQRDSTAMHPPKVPRRKQIVIEDIETEGDRQMKVMLKRQLDRTGSLEHHLANKKRFTEAAYYQPLGDEVAGTSTLTDFIHKEDQHASLDELRQFGLSSEEIQIYLSAEKDLKNPTGSGYGITDGAQAMRLDAIKQKIADRKADLAKPTNFAGAKVMSRHEMELERAISGGRDKTKVFSNLIVENTVMNPCWNDAKHPINNLDSIMEEAIEKRRKEQQQTRLNEVATCAPKPENYVSTDDIKTEEHSTLHVDHYDIESAEQKLNSEIVNRDELSGNLVKIDHAGKVDEEGRNVVCGNIFNIPKDVIEKYRLSVDDIRKLDRFKTYEAGIPSHTLFLKNLSNKVTEADLISLFGRFQDDEGRNQIVYRLMAGRMKGQAFVTFPSAAVAKDALNLVNGYHFKGKPIIIQYGRSASTP